MKAAEPLATTPAVGTEPEFGAAPGPRTASAATLRDATAVQGAIFAGLGLVIAVTTRPVDEIAASVGFTNLSHFRRVFRRHHGLPPSALRETAQDST